MNQIINGNFTDPATGRASLAFWSQDPLKPWINTHRPRSDCPGGFLAQADRDYRPGVVNVWKGGNPSTAYIETLTADGLPEHTWVALSWKAAHHMFVGVSQWQLFGRAADGSEECIGVYNAVAGVPPTKVCRYVDPVVVGCTGLIHVQYRLRWETTLADDGDGVLVGDVRLVLG